MEKLQLLDHLKRESKKLMEVAVTRKFVHADSAAVTSFCFALENCLTHRLKKRVGGLFLSMTSSDEILVKLSKLCEESDVILQLTNRLLQSKGNVKPDDGLGSPERKKLNGYSVSNLSMKFLWMRVALVEKSLPTIVHSFIENWREFYEPDSLIADQVHGPSLVWLLDGPCSLDYSKMKTPESTWVDPTAHELVQRHRIYSSNSRGRDIHQTTQSTPKRLFTLCSATNSPSLHGIPSFAREHVESLHQNAVATLLYGKNNVRLSFAESENPLQGYLSLHKSTEHLLLKWTPNPMLYSGETHHLHHHGNEKSKYWEQVLTIDLADIVYLHCHDTGSNGGSIVLISQDGVQLPPFAFPTGGSLLAFLTCLEQGLMPDGRLDPPLINKTNATVSWPKLRRNILPEKFAQHLQEKNGDEIAQDFVFRVIFSSPSIDKNELRKLLSTSNSNSPAKLNKSKHILNNNSRKSLSMTHTSKRLSRGDKPHARVALNLACEKMKHQLIQRAFQGWLASYRHLKTVRTHLASLVLPSKFPDDEESVGKYKGGLEKHLWQNMIVGGYRRHREEVMKYIYYGGVEHSIRKEVWPYLLEHYSFFSSPQHINELEKHSTRCYFQLLEECRSIEQILQEKEKDILALNGFANGDTSFSTNHDEIDDSFSLKSADFINNNPDGISRELSVSSEPLSNQSGGGSVEGDSGNGSGEFSLITSLLEKKDSLREIVEKASKRGSDAWHKLMKKNKLSSSFNNRKSSERIPFFKSETDSNELTKHLTPNDISMCGNLNESEETFDLEYDCQTCGKKIIESNVFSSLNSKPSSECDDTGVGVIECFECTHARKNKSSYDDTRIPKCNTGVVFERRTEAMDSADFVLINGEGTSLKKRTSVSSATSSYSEDILKEYAMNIHRIDKDVLRCDRNHTYFKDEQNLEKLRNIMMCYVWERLSIGYIQGMCDLCAPLLVIMDNEAKVFYCFVKLMDRMMSNFPQGTAMDMHLSNISSLLQVLDPELSDLLQADNDNTIFYFCYRWFLLDFKREMKYEDVFRVWETIWAAPSVASDHFNLFVALALIELYREIILDNRMDFTDIIKFFNEMAEQHDAKATLDLARNIVRKLQDVMHVNETEAFFLT